MSDDQKSSEILWDTWGVPHIFASSDAGVFRALGWAQMRAHGNLLLKLYGIARGRAAEYWGEAYLESDRLLRQMGLPKRAVEWSAQQSPHMQENLEAFIAGINAYAKAHAEQLSEEVRRVLPAQLDDLFAHILRVYFVYLTQLGQRPQGAPFNDIIPSTTLFPDGPNMGTGVAGSNAWAIASGRTENNKAILLTNPHLYWGDFHTFLEVHLNTPDLNLYGVAQVGWPLPRHAFNSHLGWAHTVNTLKGWDAFALELTPDGKGYWLDGKRHDFELQFETIQIRQPDGSMRSETLQTRRSLHGPVIPQQNGKPIAIRVVGVDQAPTPGIFEQYWAKAKAKNLEEFQAALKMHQNPMFTVIYADNAGNILHQFCGLVPKRKGGSWMDWTTTLPGDDSSLIWQEVHGFDELPQVLNPPAGWLQNANNAPWFTTLPPMNTQLYPAYMAPTGLTPREQRSIKMIGELTDATFEKILECAGSTHSETAERLIPLLLEAAWQGSALAQEAAAVLQNWDRSFDPQSSGADLFARWLLAMEPSDRMLSNIFAQPWSADRPLETPSGLANPALAVEKLQAVAQQILDEAGTLKRPWGSIARIRRGKKDLPGHGLLDPFGSFRSSGYQQDTDGKFNTVFGTTYVALTEFSNPLRAKVLLSYGNSSQPGSKHIDDQLELFSKKQMRDAWLTRAEIEANLEELEVI